VPDQQHNGEICDLTLLPSVRIESTKELTYIAFYNPQMFVCCPNGFRDIIHLFTKLHLLFTCKTVTPIQSILMFRGSQKTINSLYAPIWSLDNLQIHQLAVKSFCGLVILQMPPLLVVVCFCGYFETSRVQKLGLNIVYLCAKFDDSSFSCSRDIIWGAKN